MTRAYLLKLSGREQGPYSDTHIAQMFADRRVNRYTPCKLATGGEWKTIDDFLPTLKYGTQLPPPSPKPSPPMPVPVSGYNRVSLVDLDIPFLSILKMMFKWTAAAFIVFCCFIPAIIAVWLVIMTLFASLIGGAMSHLHQP